MKSGIRIPSKNAALSKWRKRGVGSRDGAPGGLRGVVRSEDDAVRAGADPGEIMLRNQTTWENNVNLSQTEVRSCCGTRRRGRTTWTWRRLKCVQTESQPMPSTDSDVFDEDIVARCDFVISRCQSDDNWNTLQPSLPVVQRSVSKHPHAAAVVRVGRRHLRVRAEQAVFSCVLFLSLACPFSLCVYINVVRWTSCVQWTHRVNLILTLRYST